MQGFNYRFTTVALDYTRLIYLATTVVNCCCFIRKYKAISYREMALYNK